MQLNLPVTSVRDLTIHGDDLVIATFGRSFWILDNMTPLRQAAEASKHEAPFLYHPAIAIRVDNDDFVGTPIPPEEPLAENPPNGAIVDYVLRSPAQTVTLEILDAQNNLVRKFSSEDKLPAKARNSRHCGGTLAPETAAARKNSRHASLCLGSTWGSSGGPVADEESEYRNPSGPKAVPGTYQIRLTVDGKTQNQPLEIMMDPRPPATPDILQQQLQIGQQAYAETLEARRALAEIGSVQKRLSEIQKKLVQEKSETQNAQLKSAISDAQSAIWQDCPE